jgi:hypothetical protein
VVFVIGVTGIGVFGEMIFLRTLFSSHRYFLRIVDVESAGAEMRDAP